MIRITIICPAAHVGDANNLGMALGYGPADAFTFGDLAWRDVQDNLYSVASLPVTPEWIVAAQSTPARPGWDILPYQISMAAAERAQALVVFHHAAGDEEPAPVPLATPDQILAIAGDPLTMLAATGLERLPED